MASAVKKKCIGTVIKTMSQIVTSDKNDSDRSENIVNGQGFDEEHMKFVIKEKKSLKCYRIERIRLLMSQS